MSERNENSITMYFKAQTCFCINVLGTNSLILTLTFILSQKSAAFVCFYTGTLMKQQNHPCGIDAKNIFGGLTCQMSVYFKHIRKPSKHL